MGSRILCVTLLALLAGCYGQPCTLITPSVLHRDSDETIVLDGNNKTFEADVEIQVFLTRDFRLPKQKISLNDDNNFLGTATVRIPSEVLAKDPKTKQYVYVTVTSPVCNLEKVVLLGHQRGYAIIQTDKTIYTPGSTVVYSIFSVDDKMSPVNPALVIEILRPGTIVEKMRARSYGSSGIMTFSYKLLELGSVGVWTISVRYEHSPVHIYSTNFEVKEYVTPTFEIQLIPQKNFFCIHDTEFTVEIKAKFLFGKPVDGMAFVRFVVMKDDLSTSIADSLRRIPVLGGKGLVVLKTEDLVKHFLNADELLQYTLYMTITLITDSGREFVESELEDIHIVSSPYNVLFTRTSQYFKPGMPYDLLVHVTYPDGSPAQRVPVVAEPGTVEGITGAEGTARLTLNTTADIETLRITVRTSDPALPPARQASASLTANVYQSGGNYLHIGVTPSEVKPGDNLVVNFSTRNTNTTVQNERHHFTYLITTTGRIVKVGRQPRLAGQSLVTMSLPITEEFIPSFRIIAYYIVGNEIVSDSIWVDVTDSCMGKLSLTGDRRRDNKVQRPASSMKLKLEADPGADVRLVIVDKGVHALNNKLKISQKKMWDSVEKSDIGCTPGGGTDSMGVFYDAGLALQSTLQTTTAKRSEQQCEAHITRRRRSSEEVIDQKMTTASSSQETVRRCCIDGMNEKGENCEGRAANIWEGRECADAFLHCCKFIRQKKEKERNPTEPDAETRGSQYEVAASRRRRSDEYLPGAEIVARTQFSESWLWNVGHMGERPDSNGMSTRVLNVFLKDSITTWEVQAVSVSQRKGICVSEPYKIQVMRKFFIDLKLPYSVVRNEQVEIQAVIYNYGYRTIKVRVELTHNPQFCSLSTAKSNFRQVVDIKPQSSVAVPFILVPLSLGDQDVEVKAAIAKKLASDGVRKKLKVVPEGVLITRYIKTVTLDPQLNGKNGVQEETVQALYGENLVPGTNVETHVQFIVYPRIQMRQHIIYGGNLNHLFAVPRGDGEGNMMTMTPNVVATIYLDATNQWEQMGLIGREEAIKNIKQGLIQQLVYHKADNSYSSSPGRPASTWLSAYVAKVFVMAQTLVDIDSNMLCGAIKWLILQKQKPNGMFKEDAPVIHLEMVGGIKGSSEDVALTAFVLIAMLESEVTCTPHVNILKMSIEKASSFLLGQLPALDKPYTIAITSYALAMAGAIDHPQKLLSAITDNSHWKDPGSHLITIEATSYALLALLRLKQYILIRPIIRWLSWQKFDETVNGATQASIMMFQALVQYQTDLPSITEVQMDVTIHLPDNPFPLRYQFNEENRMVPRLTVTTWNKEFVVRAEGKGDVSMQVTKLFHIISEKKAKECNNFYLSVTVKEEPNVTVPEGVLAVASVTICTRDPKNPYYSRSILEVSMMTGFAPDVDSLNKLQKEVDKYISQFEINNKSIDKGSIIIYLDKMSERENECIKFNVHQIFKVGRIQPASVTLYDYYSPENRCTKFYHVEKNSELLSTICQNSVCRCTEDNCFLLKHLDEAIDTLRSYERACASGVDYVYKAHLEEIQENNNYDNYVMKIINVTKKGRDEDALNNQRRFLSHIKCRRGLNLIKGRDYLIWGPNSDLWEQPDG
ncbi:A.superbus venom factor 1-like isoform X2 [Engystomops pustulosus]